jgi:mono/diheme cytochrome c family protein
MPLIRSVVLGSALVLLLGGIVVMKAQAQNQPARPTNPDTWQIPPGADKEANPLTVDDKLLAKGKSVYESKCKRCHGPGGMGDGPDGDPDHMPGDLTDSSRAAKNPDGVMFYKVWNGRKNPKMPAFKSEMTKNDAWAVVAYAKTLRQ